MSEIDLSGFVDIKGYEGLYAINQKGDIWSYISNKKLKQWKTLGYLYIALCKKHEKQRFRVARLVALTFMLNINDKPEVNHINGIKTDNDINNLEWVTGSENKKHAYKTGLMKSEKAIKAMSLARRKIKACDLTKIKELYNIKKMTYKQIGNVYNVSLHTIHKIIKNKTYKEVV